MRLPWIDPNTDPENNKPTAKLGADADPTASSIINQFNPYNPEMDAPLAPGLGEYADLIAQMAGEVATLEEAERALKELTGLDVKKKQAQTSLLQTSSSYQQALAKNANAVQKIGLAHQLAMAGLQLEGRKQEAEFRGLAGMRQTIAARVRGGA